jgi:hypothetical protein
VSVVERGLVHSSNEDAPPGLDEIAREGAQRMLAVALRPKPRTAPPHSVGGGPALHEIMRAETELLALFDFPAEHRAYLRTGNVIESPFATLRLRQ